MANKKARVLVAVVIDGDQFQPDDVVSIDEKQLDSYKGVLDADAGAVKYVESLKVKAE